METSDQHEGSLNPIFAEILRTEHSLQASFEDDTADQLQLVDRATSLLTDVMSSVEPQSDSLNPGEIAVPLPTDTQRFIVFTLMIIGLRTLRVIRTARATLALGYEIESLVNDRILNELLVHLKAIINDPSGKEAKQWLDAPYGRSMGKRVDEMAQGGLYRILSQGAHGDGRLLSTLLDKDRRALSMIPIRTSTTKTSLVLCASFATDTATMIAAAAELKLVELPSLREAVRVAWAKDHDEAEA